MIHIYIHKTTKDDELDDKENTLDNQSRKETEEGARRHLGCVFASLHFPHSKLKT